MKCKQTLQRAIFCLLAGYFLNPITGHAQNAFETKLFTQTDSLFAAAGASTPAGNAAGLFPNDAPPSVMSPTGWGGYGTYLFGGIGGTYPELYRHNKTDLITSVGVCTGNPVKAVNVAFGVNMTDVHRFRNFSANIIVSRSLGRGTSIAVGGMQLFANVKYSDASGTTAYVAVSHAVQTLPSKTPGCSKLSYSIGAGIGRFLYKSPKDIEAGRGKYGTAVFANVSYEIFQHVNLNAEWTGMNLGVSLGLRPFKNPLSIGIGAYNLTRYSGDRVSMVFSVGYPLSLNRK